VDEYVGPGERIPGSPPEAGAVRVVVPFIGGLLPVYVLDVYDGYRVEVIPDMSSKEIEDHIGWTAGVLSQICGQGVDRVLANHALFSPVIARRALQKHGVPYDVKIHGSAIEYVLAPNPQYMKYAVEGLKAAERVFAGSRHVKERILDVFSSFNEQLELDKRLFIVPPGMDPDTFTLTGDFNASRDRFLDRIEQKIHQNGSGRRKEEMPVPTGTILKEYHGKLVEASRSYDQRAVDADLLLRWPLLEENEPIIIYVGKFLAAKGVGELLVLAPTVLERIPEARFVFVGFGEYREHLEGIIRALETGEVELALACARAGSLVTEIDVKRVFRKLSAEELDRVTVTGALDHETLSDLLPLASLCIVPSKLAEAFGMVAVEAAAAGVVPICNYHSGMKDIVDGLVTTLPELRGALRIESSRFFEELPDKIQIALGFLYPEGFADHERRKEVGRKLRQFAVSQYSWEGIATRLLETR
jgi:glycosyltransferase involved in cell wall biosynthesis